MHNTLKRLGFTRKKALYPSEQRRADIVRRREVWSKVKTRLRAAKAPGFDSLCEAIAHALATLSSAMRGRIVGTIPYACLLNAL